MSVNKYVNGKLLQLSGNADTRLTTEDIVSILGYTPANNETVADTYASLTYTNDTFVKKSDIVDNTTSTDVNKPLSANQGKALNDAINTINSKNLTSYCVDKPISKIGWYRIARFKNPASTVVNGSATNSLTITIKRIYNNAPPEFHEIKFIGLYAASEFRSIFNKSQSHGFTKIRHTMDYTNKYAYIEVYYNLGSTNAAAWFLNDVMDALGSKWEAIFESTEETVDGVTVKSSMDIPANDS